MNKRLTLLTLFIAALFLTSIAHSEQTVLVFLGAPGTGKGVLCKKLSRQSGLPHISTGDLLRREQSHVNSPLSIEIAEYMTEGRLVPDEVIVRALVERIKQADCKKGFILDGFPRTLAQAQKLDKVLSKKHSLIAVNLTLEEDAIINRLLGRRSCSNCRQPYHLEYSPPEKTDTCDECGHALVASNDDCEVAIRNRIAIFKDGFAPIESYYKESHQWVEINTSGAVESTYASLLDQVHAINMDSLILSAGS